LVGASIWIEGIGEVFAHEPGTQLLPASNQKLITAIGVLALLEPDAVMRTRVVASAPPVNGVVDGDVTIVASGDPTLTRTGAHSLDALAAAVRAKGVTSVLGDLVVDAGRFERAQRAPGWQDWHVPAYAGPLSAFTLDDNRFRGDPIYLADPALANGAEFGQALRRHGVVVAGGVRVSSAPRPRHELASVASQPVAQLVNQMLLQSDNEIAEALTREAGVRSSHRGTTVAGTHAFDNELRRLCRHVRGISGDGSGLSRTNARSAREMRMLLHAARAEPWWPRLVAGLPVAARTGTLAGRFHGTAAAGNLRAKTGTIIGGRALSGYLTTAAGRDVIFSFIVNGDAAGRTPAAIDSLLATIAADRW
jgi:D-alanyl-D-alanine carboxypeptidase/D-alanyl-D-alanine-endopeptidase (penicillin-binding protein 4)